MSRITQKLQFDHLVIAAAIFVGFVSGTDQLSDNSMLVHISTGLNIIDTHHVPRVDPYSFSAHGHPWTVQSWFPEVVYGLMIKLGGAHLLQFMNALLFATVAGVTAKLARTNNLWRTLLVTVIAIGVGYSLWSTRPTMFALLFFASTVLVVTRRHHFGWLILIGLLWVNSHASWPLGIAWIALSGIGARLDGESPARFVKYALALSGAVILGGLISPAGLGVLTFPLSAFGPRGQIFLSIAEWKSPDFSSSALVGGRLLLAGVVVSFLILSRRRVTWRELLPLLFMFAAALAGVRNLTFFGVALAPVLAAGLTKELVPVEVGLRRILAVGITLFIACAALDMVPTIQRKPYDFSGYPVAAVDFLERTGHVGAGSRVAAPDYVGCYLIFRYGTNANNFIDDRYDMYPVDVAQDSLNLGRVSADADRILARYDFDSLLFPAQSPLVQYMALNNEWRVVYSDKDWKLFERAS